MGDRLVPVITGILPKHRIMPGIQEYHTRQLSQDLIPDKGNGGLYCRYFLKDHLHSGYCPANLLKEFAGPGPKTWHSHPTRRAILWYSHSRQRRYLVRKRPPTRELASMISQLCTPTLSSIRAVARPEIQVPLKNSRHFESFTSMILAYRNKYNEELSC